jgi:hypothetical protein
MRPLFLLLFLAFIPIATPGQLAASLYRAHEQYREKSIVDRRFKHSDILPLIERLAVPFSKEIRGHSADGRAIYLVKIGQGPESVLLWSQMHGDEPTATMAIFDIFNFFAASGDAFDALRRDILDKTTLFFLPMLNPDGAESYQRRNALGIDLNRDALRLESPESRILKATRDEINARWGFNLHDQNTYYSAGAQPKQASVSFLAPAYNEQKEINEVRGNAMKLIVIMNRALQNFIPGQVGKYSDTFEPRAFGDNMQKWGTSTVLIEIGGLENDPEKQELRRLHFVALLSAFEAIAKRQYANEAIADYNRIPFNRSTFHDLILREVQVARGGKWYTMDIAFRRGEVQYEGDRRYYPRGAIVDMGDLSTLFGHQELNARGYQAVPGKFYHSPLASVKDLKDLDIPALLLEGYTDFFIIDWPQDKRFHELPLRLIKEFRPAERAVQPGGNPSLLLRKDGRFDYAVINGFLFDLRQAGQLREKVAAAIR